jgi:DNA-binding response OmpR family regulator
MRKLLAGHKILIVEDAGFVAADLTEILMGAGAEVIAALRLREAQEVAARADFSAAVLDINLAGAECTGVCEILDERRIPFMFYTGYYHSHVMDRWPQAPVVLKPALAADLLECVARVVRQVEHA